MIERLLCTMILATVLASAMSAQSHPLIQLTVGTTDVGDATALWLELLSTRLQRAEYDSVVPLRRPLTQSERAWIALIDARRSRWERELDGLARPFAPAPMPSTIRLVLGNRGGSDAFTHDATTVGFDLAELQANYGDATLPQNADLMDRLFRHEFTHVMQKSWFVQHPWKVDTPLDAALVEIWLEGQGNFYSLSSRWRTTGGVINDATARARATLEPRFVARLAALACSSEDERVTLLRGLSSGPFDQKWGALPAALWLEAEESGGEPALRRFVEAGPTGVWALAERHLPAPLGHALQEAREVYQRCHPGRPDTLTFKQLLN